MDTKPGALPAQLVEHLAAGRKIDAIKALRQARQYGLREAKLLVEKLQESIDANPDAARSVAETFVRTLPAPEPVDSQGGWGCTAAILVVLAGIGVAIWYFTVCCRA